MHIFTAAARDLQLVQAKHADDGRSSSRASTLRGQRRRQSPHPQDRYRGGNMQHQHHQHLQNVYDDGNLQNSIYKKFEETETLLDQLRIQEGFGTASPQVH